MQRSFIDRDVFLSFRKKKALHLQITNFQRTFFFITNNVSLEYFAYAVSKKIKIKERELQVINHLSEFRFFFAKNAKLITFSQ